MPAGGRFAASAVAQVKTSRDEVIIHQGEVLSGGAADNFYVVGEGSFDVFRDMRANDHAADWKPPPPETSTASEEEVSQAKARHAFADADYIHLVQQRKVGDSFGELALMYNQPRQASVVCSSESAVLWALQRKVYREISLNDAMQSRKAMVAALKKVELLKSLEPDAFDKIADSFEELHFEVNDKILGEAEVGAAFYIILKGSVSQIDHNGAVLATKSRSDYFGERSLLSDEPRSYQVIANTPVTIAMIKRETFIDVLGPLTMLMEKSFTKQVLANVPMLSHLTEHERDAIVEECTDRVYEPGEAIIRAGEMGHLFFIVKEGEVHCLVQEKIVKTYQSAEYFGERALLRDEPRAADCIAATRVTCIQLEREAFVRLLGPLQQVLDYKMMKDTLRTASLFRYLTSAERENVLNAFQFVEFSEGDLIFREGDLGASFILIREGTVKLLKHVGGEEGEEVGTKGAGEHLGEKSLLDSSPREVDAVVVSKTCHIAFLDQAKFIECMGPIADVLQRANESVKIEDLDEYRLLGVGTFGKVKLVKDKTSGRIFAMKIISKAKVLQYNQQEHIMSEKTIMSEIDHPFCIQLVACFKDEQRLYMVLEYCPGGELFTLLQNERKLNDEHTCFYASSVMLAFEYLHENSIIYRDLKPENLLLDARGFCKVCDFGFAKKIEERTWTLCGTPEYLAPETIRSKGHGKGVDWWALGILIYEMASGFPPYCGDSAMQTYKLILEGNLEFPPHVKTICRDLIRKLLTPQVARRLGCLRNGSLDVRLHQWFEQIDLQQLLRMKLPVPFVPTVESEMDTQNFPDYEDVPDEPYEDDGTGWDDNF